MTSKISSVKGWSSEQISSRPKSMHTFYIFRLRPILLHGNRVDPIGWFLGDFVF